MHQQPVNNDTFPLEILTRALGCIITVKTGKYKLHKGGNIFFTECTVQQTVQIKTYTSISF